MSKHGVTEKAQLPRLYQTVCKCPPLAKQKYERAAWSKSVEERARDDTAERWKLHTSGKLGVADDQNILFTLSWLGSGFYLERRVPN